MKSLVDDKYVEEFKALLSKPGRQENAIQAFLEQHTIISKFPIGERIADYAYLTKSLEIVAVQRYR